MVESAAATPVVTVGPRLPYRPAGYSRFLAWVEGLPWHGWWVFPALLILQLVWSHGVLWAGGLIPVGTVDPVIAFGAAYGPYTLGALAYLNSVARSSLRSFWPATGWPDDQRPEWTYRFTTAPSGYGPWLLALGLVLTMAALATTPLVGGSSGGTARVVQAVAYAPTLLLGYVTFVVAAMHTIRQLRLVNRIHRLATAIDPFDRVPVYAFSRLTVRIGLAYILVGYYAIAATGSWQLGNPASLVTLPATFLIGIAVFVLPLWGIHDRLVEEKERLVQGTERRFERLSAEMYQRIDGGAFDGAKPIAESIEGVRALRDRIDHLPTWPWPPQVLRGFVSALLLPVLVYLVTRLISGEVRI